jgi:hypothetical protein
MRKLLLLPVILIFAACSTVKVGFDYDKQADFSKYKTYTISEETMKMPLNQLNRDRIISAVEAEMATKGFTKSENPDVILDIRIKGEEVQTATATTSGPGYGYGGYYRWGYGGGFSTTTVNYDKYVEGTMFITLVDRATEKIVWQGTGTKTVDENASAEKREENINYAVKQIFTNYPPTAK